MKGTELGSRIRFYLSFALRYFDVPLTHEELEISDAWLSTAGRDFYHGGTRGLPNGTVLRPSAETGILGTGWGDYRLMPWVFFTPSLSRAKYYAGLEGDVYRVRPRGRIIFDPPILRMRLLLLSDPDFRAIADAPDELQFCSPAAVCLERLGSSHPATAAH